MHYALIYEFVPDYLERRTEFRSRHLELAWKAQARGDLMLAGALAEPVDGALLIFSCDSKLIPESFAAADPYVLAGLVTRWQVREWQTVVGDAAVRPLRA